MPAIAIFASAGARRAALNAAARSQGEVVTDVDDVADLRLLLDRGGIDIVVAEGLDAETLAVLVMRHPAVRFVLFADESEAVDLVLAGGAAVLPRDTNALAIGNAIALTHLGLRLLPEIALDRLRALAGDEATPAADEMPALTPREREVLAAMADGASNKVIARRLGISFHTAKFHVASILAKLDADTRTEALARAARLGLVML
jgi:DNA-binding NarL/FixJ family response regulator